MLVDGRKVNGGLLRHGADPQHRSPESGRSRTMPATSITRPNFRSVYASIVDNWLGADSRAILNATSAETISRLSFSKALAGGLRDMGFYLCVRGVLWFDQFSMPADQAHQIQALARAARRHVLLAEADSRVRRALSILVRQGKVRKAASTPDRPGSHHRRHCFGLRRDD